MCVCVSECVCVCWWEAKSLMATAKLWVRSEEQIPSETAVKTSVGSKAKCSRGLGGYRLPESWITRFQSHSSRQPYLEVCNTRSRGIDR